MGRRNVRSIFCAALLVFGCTGNESSQFSAGVFDIGGGRKMYMECDGVGTPIVLFIAGKGNRADTWSTNRLDPQKPELTVFAQASRFTRVCAYDRPLTLGSEGEPSRSDTVPEPVTAADGVADLHALLVAADLHGPYVLVGHSFGGLIARLYASTFQQDAAGMVLEDSLSEGLYERLTAGQRDILETLNFMPERVDTIRSFAQVTGAPAFRVIPMDILTADMSPISAQDIAAGLLPPIVTEDFATALWTAQIAAQDQLAKLFPNARHITRTNSHHYIHYEQPQLVIDAIREVVDEIRSARH
jgi:pimeloyl-ACP methyl ester carboxylesterase